jgi:hypothetical protein
VDWNNDGKKDIVTGEYNGNIRIYLNTNTDADPVFNGYALLDVAGATYDAGYYSTVHVVDWNNDLKKDLLVGESLGYVFLLINTGTDPAPVYSSSVRIKDGGVNIDVGDVVSPTVLDLNGDEKKDLLVGEKLGNLHFFENVGTDNNPVFNGEILLEASGSVYDCSWYSRPCIVDWENDGVFDILCGTSNGYVGYIKTLGPLLVDDNQVSSSTGGTVTFTLEAGSGYLNRSYLLVGSRSGRDPGTPLPGGLVTLPLNRDTFTNFVLARLNSLIFTDFLGTLDGSGKATARLNVPPIPGMAGTSMYFAFATAFPWDFASNAAEIYLDP